jgi:glycine hydroxymethyltransferase
VSEAPADGGFRVLHVCTGNICRSPMAERLMATMLQAAWPEQAHRVVVESAGTWGHTGSPMEPYALATLAELGTRRSPEIAGCSSASSTGCAAGLQLIASENFTSRRCWPPRARSTLSNKYAEGYPGGATTAAASEVDKAEQIGIERAKALFGADHANLQPHSGASANIAAYGAFMSPATRCWRCRCRTAGTSPTARRSTSPASGSTPCTTAVARETEDIDYDQVRDLAREHRPEDDHLRRLGHPAPHRLRRFREIADEVGAVLMVDAAHFIGLVAGGPSVSPVPYADVVTFTTHKVLRGPRGGMILCAPSTPAASTRRSSR